MKEIEKIIFDNRIVKPNIDISTCKLGQSGFHLKGPICSHRNDLMSLLRLIEKKLSENDNLNKLRLAKTDEKHLFIPVMSYNPEASDCLRDMEEGAEFSFSISKLKNPASLQALKEIQVIWLACFFDFKKQDEKLCFHLAKVTLVDSNIVIKKIFYKESY